MALITVTQLEDRLGYEVDNGQATELIADAGAIVVDYAHVLGVESSTTDTWDESTTPRAIQAVVSQMVQRGVRNPMGYTGENLGDHGWQANPRVGVGPYLAPSEKKIIRKAVGKLGVNVVAQEGYLPVEPRGFDTDNELEL